MTVGNDVLDSDHKVLIELINTCSEGGPSFGEVFSRLIDYVGLHFDREEVYMEEIGYADIERHRRLHDGFAARVNGMLRDHSNDVMAPADTQVADFMWDWLRDHILVEDRKYAVFAERSGKAPCSGRD